jgi:thiamine-monophosphate kinase
MVGSVENKNLGLRNGAKPGDLIYVSGPLGFGRAGLRLFQKKQKGFDKIKKRYLEPKARLDYTHKVSSFVNSMIDVSDGLAPEVRHICDHSKCGAVIYKDKIPIDDKVQQVAKAMGEDEYDYALYGGEDFELLFTISKDNIDKIDGYLVGEITKDKTVKLCTGNNKKIITTKGYDHFSLKV